MLRFFPLLLVVRAFIPNKGIINLIFYKIKVTLPYLKLLLLIEPLLLVEPFFLVKASIFSSKSLYY